LISNLCRKIGLIICKETTFARENLCLFCCIWID